MAVKTRKQGNSITITIPSEDPSKTTANFKVNLIFRVACITMLNCYRVAKLSLLRKRLKIRLLIFRTNLLNWI